MTQYMLLLRADPAHYTDVTPEQLQAMMQKFDDWAGPLVAEGRLKDGKKLADRIGRFLTRSGGRLEVRDGPFGEAKEMVGGFFVIEADSYDHAVEMVKQHPNLDFPGGSVEIREFDYMGQEPPPA